MTIEGKLERLDLGPGVWVVTTDQGSRFTLDGAVPEGLADKRVRIEGALSDSMGIGMVGDTVKLTSVVRA
jgi:hypothetical protein